MTVEIVIISSTYDDILSSYENFRCRL